MEPQNRTSFCLYRDQHSPERCWHRIRRPFIPTIASKERPPIPPPSISHLWQHHRPLAPTTGHHAHTDCRPGQSHRGTEEDPLILLSFAAGEAFPQAPEEGSPESFAPFILADWRTLCLTSSGSLCDQKRIVLFVVVCIVVGNQGVPWTGGGGGKLLRLLPGRHVVYNV